MTKLKWDVIGKRLYETGTSKGVLYAHDALGKAGNGVAWSGLTKVTQSPTGGEETALYADDIKYLSLFSAEVFEGTIEAYAYPDEFGECDGSKEASAGLRIGQQPRKPFSMAYVSRVGNDVVGTAAGYKIHLLYNLKASPSERAHETINETPGAITFSWGITSTPVVIEAEGYIPTSTIEIDSLTAPAAKLKALEDILFGTAALEAKIPTPDEVITLFKSV